MLQKTFNLNYIIRCIAVYASSIFNKCFLYMCMPAANFSYANQHVVRRDIHVMPINYRMKFDVSEYENSNAIIKVNCATFNYFGYSYVNINGKGFTVLADAHGKFILWNVFTQSVFM